MAYSSSRRGPIGSRPWGLLAAVSGKCRHWRLILEALEDRTLPSFHTVPSYPPAAPGVGGRPLPAKQSLPRPADCPRK
jgi:hypothetical protein